MFGLFKRYDVHLCPAVAGRITDNGVPLAAVTVQRELVYADNKVRRDKVTTDADGRFSLPERNIRSSLPGNMFAHDHTWQLISLEHDGRVLTLWNVVHKGIAPTPEFDAKLRSLNADIRDPLVGFGFRNNTVPELPFGGETICRWDSDFEVIE